LWPDERGASFISADNHGDTFNIGSTGEEVAMDIQEIRQIAGQLGINPTRMGKTDLIQAIQRAEGIADCFGFAAAEECEEESCLWREDCLFESVAEEETA
jgi:hypothetical protein